MFTIKVDGQTITMYTHGSNFFFNTTEISQDFFCWLQVSNGPNYSFLYPKIKFNEGFLLKAQILPIGKNFQEIGLKYKQILCCGWNMAQNVSSTYKKICILSRHPKDTREKAEFERDYMKLHSCHIIKKGGSKGLNWCHIAIYIGENWRKLAEIG